MTMNEYSKVRSNRHGIIDGLGPWAWAYDNDITWHLIAKDWVESHKEVYKRYVKDWSSVVQAGGNLGLYPRLFSQMFSVVYTFEPDPLNFYYLVQNCQADNIVKMQAALGCERTPVSIVRNVPTNIGMNTVVSVPGSFVPQLLIDDLNLEKCGLIALDIEGYEYWALKGAETTIKKCKPVIACERPTKEVVSYLDTLGYDQKEVSCLDGIFVHRDH